MVKLRVTQNELIKASQAWVLGHDFNPAKTQKLREEAIRLNHAHYMENIPIYRKLAEEEGCGKDVDITNIKKKLMLSAGIFKSYEQSWLDDGDFSKMNQWLSGIYHKHINMDMPGVKKIDDWIERLGLAGIDVVYSSGTSDAFSFIPRDKQDWKLAKTANIAYLAPLMATKMRSVLSHQLLKSAIRLMPPAVFTLMASKNGLPDFDAVFLGFRHGKMGNQALIRELAQLFHRQYFLYDMGISGSTLRSLRRDVVMGNEIQLMQKLQTEIFEKNEENYLRIVDNIQHSTGEGQKVFIFGAPYQFRELCKIMTGHNRRLVLKKGSLILFGGGWKSFAEEAIAREMLVDMLTDIMDIDPEMILEGYSMTEINMLMLRCEHGRFHIPPVIEPVIFDEELNPLEGNAVSGAFGFLDPLAVAYPGFIISGDYVRMVDDKCDCGLAGPAITKIGRMPGAEVKGCGGIMGSMRV